MKILSVAIILIITLFLVPLFTWFTAVDPGPQVWQVLRILLVILLCVTALTFILGEITGNNSQVDKIWSIIPMVYVWVVAAYGDFSVRLVLMAVLVSTWGIRLTANFAMKGAYSWKFWEGEEDYRWKLLRQKPEFRARWKWSLFNLFFISSYQNALILLFTLPSLIALQFNSAPLNVYDVVVAVLMLIFIAFETIADVQHWRFQSAKYNLIRSGQPLNEMYAKGFLDRGLWKYSRHPNYFAEQAVWISFYFFSVTASGLWFNWSIAGCLLLIILFMGSSAFSEEISASKYPLYIEYQKKVSRFIPMPQRKLPAGKK